MKLDQESLRKIVYDLDEVISSRILYFLMGWFINEPKFWDGIEAFLETYLPERLSRGGTQ